MVTKMGMVATLLTLGDDAPGWEIVQGTLPCGHGFCALLARPSGPQVPLWEWGPELVELEACLEATSIEDTRKPKPTISRTR